MSLAGKTRQHMTDNCLCRGKYYRNIEILQITRASITMTHRATSHEQATNLHSE